GELAAPGPKESYPFRPEPPLLIETGNLEGGELEIRHQASCPEWNHAYGNHLEWTWVHQKLRPGFAIRTPGFPSEPLSLRHQNGRQSPAPPQSHSDGGSRTPHDACHLANSAARGPVRSGRLGRVRRALRAAHLPVVPTVEITGRRRRGRDPGHPDE